jgi:hypothetical protein
VFTNAIVAGTLAFTAICGGSPTAPAPLEDEPGFNCATQGNHICGPKGDAPAGLYRDGELIVPWTNYSDPQSDPLYGVMPGTEYDNLGAQLAALHQADAAAITFDTCVPDTTCEGLEAPARWTPEYYGAGEGGELCSTDAACSAYTRDFGGEYGYGATPEKAVLWDGIPAL